MSVAAALLLLVAGGEQQTEWRAVATVADRARLRAWRDDWRQGLAAAAGDRAAMAALDPALLDPDGALDRPLPPAGDYRCRSIRVLPARLAVDDWGRCRIATDGALLRLDRVDGGQRFAGLIYADATRRGVFLGAAAYDDERHPAAYGHAAGRDMAGLVERIGDTRWRLVLPAPKFGSRLDLIELVPER